MKKEVFFSLRRAKDGPVKLNSCLELTPAAQQELYRLEKTLLEQGRYPGGDAETAAELLERSQFASEEQGNSKAPQVGVFYVVDDEVLIASIPMDENPTYAGYRTFGVGNYDFWNDLSDRGRVPPAVYNFYSRGRVIYHEATHQFTILTDVCVVRNKRLSRAILDLFHLPRSTQFLADAHYACAKCQKGEEPNPFSFLDYNLEWLAFYLTQIGAK